jgi:inhibitor of cysteine peptidase
MAVVELSGSDNGRSVELREGDEVLLRLAENPTTGFRWHIDQAEGIEPAGEAFHLGRDPRIGSGGVHEFRFRRTGRGPGRLALRNWQPWAGESSVTERFAVEFPPATDPP